MSDPKPNYDSTTEEWKRQRMFCKAGHVFNQDEATGSIDRKRCPICKRTAMWVYTPIEAIKYLYVNNDQRYYSH